MIFSVFLKPKGFIKIPELIFSICVFSVLVSYEKILVFTLHCGDSTTRSTTTTAPSTTPTTTTTTTKPLSTTVTEPTTAEFSEDLKIYDHLLREDVLHAAVNFPIAYPFKFGREDPTLTAISDCNGTTRNFVLEDNSSSKAMFFVIIGVFTLIFTLFMIAIYLFEGKFFSGYRYYLTTDLFIHIIFLIFWFCAAITWTAGEANLRVSTDAENVLELNGYKFDCGDNGIKCTVEPPGDYTEAVVSVVFGYVNLLLFAGNAWFLYKDTTLHAYRLLLGRLP
ncbi:UNVERIFIED_CONTAM: hypothetical protein RMT77_000463 [Armadillidium vulgare]